LIHFYKRLEYQNLKCLKLLRERYVVDIKKYRENKLGLN